MIKNLGPAVSGYLDPTGRSFETTVFQAGKPVLDRELILSEDIDGGAAQAAMRTTMPSGWLSDDFLTTSSSTSAIHIPLAVANTIEIPESVAHINGWIINVRHTNNAGKSNRIDLGPGPIGAGAQRTDLVILEVWRRLISAPPDTAGKSATGRIWFNGNVKIAPADNMTLNFDDEEILDTNVGTETTKRVQIQYRLRVVTNVDVFNNPYGIDDPAVVAHSVPPSAAEPDGAPVAGFTYTNQSQPTPPPPTAPNQWLPPSDPGLWVAGDGIPGNDLKTVDGYMYAVPLLAVFRRNTTAFAHVLNQNGGKGVATGLSDRPDGLFSDIIVGVDLLDLRHGVSPNGWSLAELLQKNTNAILDNSLRTEITDTSPAGGGCRGTTVFMANEIGGAASNGAPASPLQQFDAVRRRFSDRSIYETLTIKLPPPGATWVNNDSVTISPSALPVYPYAAFNWDNFAPLDVVFMDVLEAHWAGPTLTHRNADAIPHIVTITGLGSLPVVNLGIRLGTIAPLGLTDESLFVTLLVAYPRGTGLTHTPVETYGAKSFALITPANLPAAAPISFASFGPRAFDQPHREVQLQYQTVALTYTQGSGTAPTKKIVLPERANAGGLVVTTTPPQVPVPTLSASGREISLAVTPNPGSLTTVKYTATRPMPQQSSPQMAVYFRTAAPQMARNAILGTTITVIPKLVADKLLSLTIGSGSQTEAYPFLTAYVQTGGVFPTLIGTYNGESDLAGTAEISVADFDAATGMLNLPTYISMVANPESLTFTRGLGDTDVEGRTYFPTVPAGYIPNAYAQDLSNSDRHKNVLPMLAELASDSLLGRRGQLVIILLIRYAFFDPTNGVFFDAELNSNTTTASIFRVKGLLLNKRAN